MSDTPEKTDSARNEEKSNRFQREFDRVLLGLLGAGLAVTLLYGASAGTCSAGPQRASQIVTKNDQTLRPTATQGAAPKRMSAADAASSNAAAATNATGAPSGASATGCADSNGLVGLLLALLIAFAALAVGAFAGFLFGLPRSLTSSDFRAAAQAKVVAREKLLAGNQEGFQDGAASESPAGRQASEVNTNLEKISDWLTTIIVGVGLTKLQEIPGGIETFGERVAPYFGYGGKVFGIAAGLFFLIGGFFLTYVGTRVKLSFLFLWSQLMNWGATEGLSGREVRTALKADPVPADGSAPVSDELKKADQALLKKSLSDLKTSEEVLAWANAKARAGDFASALTAYRDALSRVPVTEKLQTNYAQVLAATGDTAGANNIVASLATTGISPEAELQARQKVAAGAAAGQTAALRARLQQGLYKAPAERGYDDAIAAGEQLLAGPEPSPDPWVHLWLAAAYGQKHAVEKAAAGAAPSEAQNQELDKLRSRAVEEVKKALDLDPKIKGTVRGLYDPAYRIGNDDDLDSLRPDEALDSMLSDPPPDHP